MILLFVIDFMTSVSDCHTGYVPGPDPEVFGSELNFMVSLLAGGGALLLLISVLIICACRSCRQQKKHQQGERHLHHL